MAMAPLPSFVELMASLGLANDSEDAACDPLSRRTSTSSAPSRSPSLGYFKHWPDKPPSADNKLPAMGASEPRTLPSTRERDPNRRGSAGNIRATRFAPYSPPTRRGSLPCFSESISEAPHSVRTQSISHSRRSSSTSVTQDSDAEVGRPPRRAPKQKAAPPAAVTTASTPISTFARRRSPTISPTSRNFPHLTRNSPSIVPTPVSIPTLPPLLAESFASYSFPTASSEDTVKRAPSRGDSPRSSPQPAGSPLIRTHQYHAGVRISSPYRPCAHQIPLEGKRVSPLV